MDNQLTLDSAFSPPGKLSLVLADDSENFAQPCASALRKHGIDVTVVEKDGKRVIDLILSRQPDVVIMDFFLPRIDSVGVMKQVKTTLPDKPIHFMVMSAHDSPLIEREAMMAGAEYYF